MLERKNTSFNNYMGIVNCFRIQWFFFPSGYLKFFGKMYKGFEHFFNTFPISVMYSSTDQYFRERVREILVVAIR